MAHIDSSASYSYCCEKFVLIDTGVAHDQCSDRGAWGLVVTPEMARAMHKYLESRVGLHY